MGLDAESIEGELLVLKRVVCYFFQSFIGVFLDFLNVAFEIAFNSMGESSGDRDLLVSFFWTVLFDAVTHATEDCS